MTVDNRKQNRTLLFISKATPGDDDFALWLAPKLEAEGFSVFADVTSLQAGDRWRKAITNNLQDCAVKMLLCCSDDTLAREAKRSDLPLLGDLVDHAAENIFDDAPDFHRQVKAEFLSIAPTQLLRETTLAPEKYLNKHG